MPIATKSSRGTGFLAGAFAGGDHEGHKVFMGHYDR